MLIRVGGYWTIWKGLKGKAVWKEFDRRTIFFTGLGCDTEAGFLNGLWGEDPRSARTLLVRACSLSNGVPGPEGESRGRPEV